MVFNAFSQFIDFIFRILVPQPGIEPGPMAVKAPSPNHWTTKELSYQFFFNFKVFFFTYIFIFGCAGSLLLCGGYSLVAVYKGHEEGGSAYANAGSSLRSPPGYS